MNAQWGGQRKRYHTRTNTSQTNTSDEPLSTFFTPYRNQSCLVHCCIPVYLSYRMSTCTTTASTTCVPYGHHEHGRRIVSSHTHARTHARTHTHIHTHRQEVPKLSKPSIPCTTIFRGQYTHRQTYIPANIYTWREEAYLQLEATNMCRDT